MVENEVAPSWRAAVTELMELLRRTPVLSPETHQREQLSSNEIIELRTVDGVVRRDHESRALNVTGERFADEMDRLVRRAGFRPDVAPAVITRLTRNARPTFVFDEAESARLQEQAAAAVEPVLITYREGDVLIRRGQVLEERTRVVLVREQRVHIAAGPRMPVWLGRAGMTGGVLVVTMAMGAYLWFFYPRSLREPQKIVAVAAATALVTVIALWGAAANPGLLMIVAFAPTVFLAVVFAIAFDQRLAIAFAALQGLLVCAALGQTPAIYLVALVGVAAAAWRLREIRNRKAILSAGAVTAGAMAVALLFAALIDRPLAGAGVSQGVAIRGVAIDALQVGIGAMFVAFLALGLLPVIERAFDVSTGMTLIELRDPKHPLLRELAQRAPGTYTHSITVATLVEAAADAIGADGLHAYVGSLYHDIGKMNKPEYFVENQAGGLNRHNKLSPAMSLLVIVGHVKDGVELAREYNLPRSIRSYIETHHGTTLVEYFYQRARERADEASGDTPAEFGYRYPGPKPRTKEEAILMLCDAVESASRALGEPTPSRIEGLVQTLATKRLMDGQFDECDLTLRELHIIEQTVIKSLNSIYHARIAYPSGGSGESGNKQQRKPTQPASDVAAAKSERVG
ncbi:MAG: HDIG domain-containing protein [Phycisphaerales bacterium]|nr:MAG: HDIG domain-containing protein [Phycisphaerales bacterium]